MGLDGALLSKAADAAERMGEAERSLTLARADYHAAVRRLHLAGGSVREIGQALGISHQRVQQIVRGAGGSWWRRMWRTRRTPRDAVCTFCGKPPGEAAGLIAGPDVCICDACVARAAQALGPRLFGRDVLLAEGVHPHPACSFCGARRGADRPLAHAAEAALCTACLRACQEILAERGPAPAP
jgi:hypothetical protein